MLSWVFLSSPLSDENILEIAREKEILLVDGNFVKSKKELDLAAFLTEESFKNNKNIAKKRIMEFALYLSGKRDIRSALKTLSYEDKSNILALSFKHTPEEILSLFKGKKLNRELSDNWSSLSIERISLSRVLR